MESFKELTPADSEVLEAKLETKTHLIFNEGGNNPAIREDGQEELEYLKKEVEKSDGKLMVLVHPFYEDYAKMPRVYREIMQAPDSPSADFLKERLKECNAAIDAVLADNKRLPLVILEDRGHLDACVRHCLTKGIDMDRDVYLVPTFESMGTLFMESPKDLTKPRIDTHPLVVEDYRKRVSGKGDESPLQSQVMKHLSDQYKFATWAYITLTLKNIGVKEIYLGGKYLDLDENSKGENVLARCLGEAYNYFDFMTKSVKDIEAKLTDMTFPFKADEVADVRMLSD